MRTGFALLFLVSSAGLLNVPACCFLRLLTPNAHSELEQAIPSLRSVSESLPSAPLEFFEHAESGKTRRAAAVFP